MKFGEKRKEKNNFLISSNSFAGIPRMPGKITGRDAVPHLHGSQLRHRPVSVRTRGRLFGLRETVRTLSPLSCRYRPLSDDISPDRVNARR